MAVEGHKPGRIPGGLRPNIVIRLKKGWTFESDSRAFISRDGQKLSPMKDLPEGSRLVYVAPELAQAVPESLSEDERNLARYLHVILPEGTGPSAYFHVLRKWACIDKVEPSPDISLP